VSIRSSTYLKDACMRRLLHVFEATSDLVSER